MSLGCAARPGGPSNCGPLPIPPLRRPFLCTEKVQKHAEIVRTYHKEVALDLVYKSRSVVVSSTDHLFHCRAKQDGMLLYHEERKARG